MLDQFVVANKCVEVGPQVFLLFSWGGNEGTHTIANVNPSLLGGGGRPSLF